MGGWRSEESTLGPHDQPQLAHDGYYTPGVSGEYTPDAAPQYPNQDLRKTTEKEIQPYPDYPEVVEAPPVWSNGSAVLRPRGEGDGLPIVHTPQQEQKLFGQKPFEQTPVGGEAGIPASSPSKAQRLSARAFWALIAIAIAALLALGLGIGLGVGLRHANNSTTAASAASASSASSSGSSSSPTASSSSPAASSSASSTSQVCTQGIKYCGWDLIQSMGYSNSYLSSTGSSDPYDDLFLCGNNNSVSLNTTCGGSYSCMAPDYGKNGCSTSTSQSCCASS